MSGGNRRKDKTMEETKAREILEDLKMLLDKYRDIIPECGFMSCSIWHDYLGFMISDDRNNIVHRYTKPDKMEVYGTD